MSSDFTPQCRYFANPDPAALRAWLLDLRRRAYAPGSLYKVADLLGMRCETGMLYFAGVNVECSDYRQTVHSEECAIGFMVTALGKKSVIHEGWVSGAPAGLTGPCNDPMADKDGQPCGNCRQQILGLAASEDIPIHCLSLNGHDNVKSIGYLLPDAFQFEDFDLDAAHQRQMARGGIAPMDPTDILENVIRRGTFDNDQIFSWLNRLESIDYASRIAQSVILKLDNGFYVAGVKVENAAFTGFNAMQAALGNAGVNFDGHKVEAIYALSTSRRPEHQGSGNLIYPLSLPSLQGLNEFISHSDIPVTLFASNGDSIEMDYSQSADLFSSFDIQAYHINGGALRAA